MSAINVLDEYHFIPKNGHLRRPDIIQGAEGNYQWLFDIPQEEYLPSYFRKLSYVVGRLAMKDILPLPYPKGNNRKGLNQVSMVATEFLNFSR